MPRKKGSVNKSEEIRKLLGTNPKMPTPEVISTLAGQGIKVRAALVYFVKGTLSRRRGRRRKAQQMVARVAATGNADPLATILKVKGLANEVGGMRKLKGLVDALSE
jgi:hypothetical protein